MTKIPLSEPLFCGNELKYTTDCIKSTWVSSGKYIDKFEKSFATFCNTSQACAVSSGTSALHISALALGIKSGDEVIIPDLTYISTANIVSYIGAKPILVDVDRKTWTIDVTKIEEKITKKTKAIIPVHLYGHPADMGGVRSISRRYKLKIIEDACESLGALFRGKKVGSLSDAGCFSFSGNKIVTTGEGGMIVSNNSSFINKVEAIKSNYNDVRYHFFHSDIGHPFRYSNLSAALGLAQFENINKFIKIKIKNAETYSSYLDNLESIQLPAQASWAKNTYWLYGIILKKPNLRGKMMDYLLENGIQTRPFFTAMHNLPMYKTKEKFLNSEYLSKNGICLPSGLTLKQKDIEYVCSRIEKFLKKYA